MVNATTYNYDVIVVGAGAAGMMAAGRAAMLGARILLLEKNRSVGAKLSITGGERCNITNNTPNPKEFLEKFPDAKKYLYSPFSVFSVQDTIEFFESRGLPLVTQARNRMFPQTERARDVTRVMKQFCDTNGVTTQCNTKVHGIGRQGMLWSIETNRGIEYAPRVIVSTGGYAAPETGSTGDGFSWLEDIGHTVSRPSPSIVPLETSASWVHRLAGTDWSYLKMRFYAGGKQQINKTGKILFTHFGISGPMVLNTSKEVADLLTWADDVECSLDLYPETELGELDTRIVKLINASPRKTITNTLHEMFPRALCTELLALCEIDASTPSAQLGKDKRKALVRTLKDLRFPITGTMGFDRAVIADGGVNLDEINFKTMESHKAHGLYIIGDLLNINRPSGGYSLQLCWTTGWVAGSSALDD